MTVVGVGFSWLVAASYSTARMERRMQRMVMSFGIQAEEVLRVREREGQAAAEDLLRGIAADLEDNLWLLEDGQVRISTGCA